MGNECSCGKSSSYTSSSSKSAPVTGMAAGLRRLSASGSRDSDGEYIFGTVLDRTIGLAGVVISTNDANNPTIITVASVTTDGTFVRAALEAGLKDLFKTIKPGDFVYCALVSQQLTAQLDIRGVCFWILNFGSTTQNSTKQVFPSARDPNTPDFATIIATSDVWSPRSTDSAGTTLIRKLGAMVDGRLDVAPAVCNIAAMKAVLSPGFASQASALVADGYFPVGYECCPGALDSSYAGYVNVAFRFRNAVQDERLIVVPVNLSTWTAADRLTSVVGAIREVDSSLYSCSRPPRLAVMSDCATVTISDGHASLNVPYAGNVSISVPSWVPNGTVAEACYKVCKSVGVPCGVEVWVNALGQEVASKSWGCC
jgi:hypothetical protein